MRFSIKLGLLLTLLLCVAYQSGNAKESKKDSVAEFLLIDVSKGGDAKEYPVKMLDKVPADFKKNSRYKTDWILLKRIPKGNFVMGSPDTELGRDDDEQQHKVVISKPFYIGVMEVTQSQFEKVMGYNPTIIKGQKLPVGNVSWLTVRGGNWPGQNQLPAKDSFIGKLREKAGLKIDLPTEAQWEYSCRAGTKSAFYDGTDIKDVWKSDAVNKFARVWATQYYNNKCNYFADVGSYLPNAWGLYDMIGNMWEWCRDAYAAYPTKVVVDPEGGLQGVVRVIRGGAWDSAPGFCRSACRACRSQSESYMEVGFRIVCEP